MFEDIESALGDSSAASSESKSGFLDYLKENKRSNKTTLAQTNQNDSEEPKTENSDDNEEEITEVQDSKLVEENEIQDVDPDGDLSKEELAEI